MSHCPIIDLHFHSTCSEGDRSPEELLALGKKNNVQVMALADHNTIAGVSDFLSHANGYGITAISGVELYVHYQKQSLHLLGYNFDPTHDGLQQSLKSLAHDNLAQLDKNIAILQKHGFTIAREAITRLSADNYGVVHLLREIEQHPENREKIRHELPETHNDFFKKIDHYFGDGGIASFSLSEIDITEAIRIIHDAGGFTSLAHPAQQLATDHDDMIVALQKSGLDAIEVLSPYHSWHDIQHYQHVAEMLGLSITGGSDFHGSIGESENSLLDRQWDYFHVPVDVYHRLKQTFPKLP